MKNKIVANSLCFNIVLKIYKSVRIFINHSIICKGLRSFMQHIHNYSRHSRILKYLGRENKNQEISLYRAYTNKIEKIIANSARTTNNIYRKSSVNSLFFNFFHRELENIKKDPHTYVLLVLLGSIVSFNVLGLFFNRFYLKQLIISALSVITIIIFYLNPSNIIKNSTFVNVFIRFLNSDIKE